MKKILIFLAAAGLAAFLFFVAAPAFRGSLVLPPSISLGQFEFRWYGIIMALSVLVGYGVARTFGPRFGVGKQEVDDFSFWIVIVSFLGARLYYVFFAFGFFQNHPEEILKIWHGGLSIYGAITSGLVFCFLWGRRKAYGFRSLLDVLGLSLPLAQALGRWGNFFNQEAFGLPTNLPWKMFVSQEYRPEAFVSESYFHPTFLYESLLMVAAFLALRMLVGKVRPGVVGMAYIALYSLARFFIEPLRLDSVWLGGFRADQIVALSMILLSGAFILQWEFADRQLKETN